MKKTVKFILFVVVNLLIVGISLIGVAALLAMIMLALQGFLTMAFYLLNPVPLVVFWGAFVTALRGSVGMCVIGILGVIMYGFVEAFYKWLD